MKTTTQKLFSAIGLFVVLFSSIPQNTIAQNIYDDIYYSPVTTQPAVGTMPTPSLSNNSTTTTDPNGNTYITNNYYGNTDNNPANNDDTYVYIDDNDYDYYYTSRINRFHRPLGRFGYYSNYYMGNGYYNDFAFNGGYNNWFWGTPIISFNTPWLWFFNTAPYYNYYNNYAYYYPNRWNNWGWNNCHNHYNNWGWNSNWAYNNSWNNGWGNGYYPYAQQNNYYYYGDNNSNNGNNGGYTNNNDNNGTHYGPRPGMGGGYTGTASQGGRPLPGTSGSTYPNGGKNSETTTAPTRPVVNDAPNNNNYTRPITTIEQKDYNKPNYQGIEIKENTYTRPTNPTLESKDSRKDYDSNNNNAYTRPVQSPMQNNDNYNKPNYQSNEVKENTYTRPANAPTINNNNNKGDARPYIENQEIKNEPKNEYKNNDKKGNAGSIKNSNTNSRDGNKNNGGSINRGGGSNKGGGGSINRGGGSNNKGGGGSINRSGGSKPERSTKSDSRKKD